MPSHSGESFTQMLRRVESRSASRAAEGAMPSFAKKDMKDDKGFAPAQKSNLAPPFSKKGSGKRPKKAFTPASRALRGGAR